MLLLRTNWHLLFHGMSKLYELTNVWIDHVCLPFQLPPTPWRLAGCLVAVSFPLGRRRVEPSKSKFRLSGSLPALLIMGWEPSTFETALPWLALGEVKPGWLTSSWKKHQHVLEAETFCVSTSYSQRCYVCEVSHNLVIKQEVTS